MGSIFVHKKKLKIFRSISQVKGEDSRKVFLEKQSLQKVFLKKGKVSQKVFLKKAKFRKKYFLKRAKFCKKYFSVF